MCSSISFTLAANLCIFSALQSSRSWHHSVSRNALAGHGVDAFVLIRHDAHAGAGAADQHCPVIFAALHLGRHFGGHLIVGVHLVEIHGAEIVKVHALLGEPGLHGLLGGEAGFVASDCNFHDR